MTSQDDNAKRWQFSLRWLFFVTVAVASGAWSWLLLYRPDPDAPLSWWDMKRSHSIEVFNCSLIGAGLFGILLICNLIMKRWRPRFSVSTLVVVVTLVCCYFGAWEATKTWGIPAVTGPGDDVRTIESPCPFVIYKSRPTFIWNLNVDLAPHRYVWFFGWVEELPLAPEL